MIIVSLHHLHQSSSPSLPLFFPPLFPSLARSFSLRSNSILPFKEDSHFHPGSEVVLTGDPFIAGRWEELWGEEGQAGGSLQPGQSGWTRYTKQQLNRKIALWLFHLITHNFFPAVWQHILDVCQLEFFKIVLKLSWFYHYMSVWPPPLSAVSTDYYSILF